MVPNKISIKHKYNLAAMTDLQQNITIFNSTLNTKTNSGGGVGLYFRNSVLSSFPVRSVELCQMFPGSSKLFKNVSHNFKKLSFS